ncbi:hypothetical protein Q4603_20080 [Zobellia galactanivorans]|uniref:hypothetical protein n=1 Tax=Zobellia galactanivorans (strain DSM 12802 / CCUG 47099 / CIP 106680 / NCIMB 13871 / Dsij) TaxID=63186 RepID=UPI001C078ECD|nr:hypothetical protein [Zobellia galactanivorans]MBU3025204.1 hypothetical protein [Zobellia galactanivorans]MDO6810931.1 hypothetical protein [Zobellia galactanivorans]
MNKARIYKRLLALVCSLLIISCGESPEDSATKRTPMDGVKETQIEAMEKAKEWARDEEVDTTAIDSTRNPRETESDSIEIN